MKELRVEMLGGLSVYADGRALRTGKDRITKPWKLFCLLLVGGGPPVPTGHIIDVLWGDADIEDYANTAKNAVYTLRRHFGEKPGEKGSVVVFRQGGYMLNPDIALHWDCDEFNRLCEEGENTSLPTADREQRCVAALSLYRTAGFLPSVAYEQWAVPFSMYYQKRYLGCVYTLCELLYRDGRYRDLLQLAETVTLTESLDETCYVYMFRAMEKLEMYAGIVTTYYKIAGYFEEELGTPLGEELQQIYARAAEKTSRTTQDMVIIREDLRQQTRGDAFRSGGFYCDYETFKSLYQMVARMAARSGSSVMLLLINLVDSQNRAPSRQLLPAVMAELREVIRHSLRRSDTFAKYSANQYIIMLQTDSLEKARIATDRILAGWKDPFTRLATKLSRVGPDESIYFSEKTEGEDLLL